MVKAMESVIFTEIHDDKLRLVLTSPLKMQVRREDDYFMIDFPDAHIYIAEESFQEAVDMFHEEFAFAWREYAEAVDDILSGDARELKAWLLAHARRTE